MRIAIYTKSITLTCALVIVSSIYLHIGCRSAGPISNGPARKVVLESIPDLLHGHLVTSANGEVLAIHLHNNVEIWKRIDAQDRYEKIYEGKLANTSVRAVSSQGRILHSPFNVSISNCDDLVLFDPNSEKSTYLTSIDSSTTDNTCLFKAQFLDSGEIEAIMSKKTMKGDTLEAQLMLLTAEGTGRNPEVRPLPPLRKVSGVQSDDFTFGRDGTVWYFQYRLSSPRQVFFQAMSLDGNSVEGQATIQEGSHYLSRWGFTAEGEAVFGDIFVKDQVVLSPLSGAVKKSSPPLAWAFPSHLRESVLRYDSTRFGRLPDPRCSFPADPAISRMDLMVRLSDGRVVAHEDAPDERPGRIVFIDPMLFNPELDTCNSK